MPAYIYGILYLIMINIFAIAITVHDKRSAIRHRHRISEAALLWVAVLGGSPAMYLTMLLIRHKTRHLKFMLGIPVILIMQVVPIFIFILRRYPI
jgi:uncharacterized membrane protein YsdA (DUF1294 family)